MPTERIYILGTGVIAGTHAEAIERLPGGADIELHATDLDAGQLRRFCERFPRTTPHADAASMLAVPPREDDIVIVAAWPCAHYTLTMQGLASGRHVLCEKPLAMDLAEARAMLDKAREVGRLLGCCSTRFLGLGVTEALKAFLAEGRIGDLYHVGWCCRSQRTRPGIEYQPETPWFLERRLAGGGILLDWAPYDFTMLNDILEPLRVDVIEAWTAAPHTHAPLPPGTVMDVEFHGAAWLVYHLPDGRRVPVNYERASCTHGAARKVFEFEGRDGALFLDWLGEDGLTYGFDDAGQPKSVTTPPSPDDLGPMKKPLCFFHQAVNEGCGPAVLNERAVFNFACIRAIYECEATGRAQSVSREDFA